MDLRIVSVLLNRYVVFYNGREERPDYEEFRLSDLYTIQSETVSLKLIVEVFNINKGHNTELVETCKNLQDYVEYTHRVRTYAEKLPIEEAVEKAINECIQESILKDFLEANRAEVMKVSIYEYHERKRAWEGTAFTQRAANEDRELCSRYNEQEHMRMEREDAFEDGRKVGLDEGHRLGLNEGLETGRNQLFELMNKMSADGLGNQTHRLASEPDFYQEMVKKYLDI